MRVIGGIYKGRKPSGTIPENIRPTTDSTRETIFNVIDNYLSLENSVVLDLFCGTGMLGIEALSRGAEKCYFVDKSFKAIDFVQKFLTGLNLPGDKYSLQKLDALKYLKLSSVYFNDKYDLIFIDPPYNQLISNKIINLIQEQNLLSDDGIIIVEHSDSEIINVPKNFERIKGKMQGSTVIDFLKIRM